MAHPNRPLLRCLLVLGLLLQTVATAWAAPCAHQTGGAAVALHAHHGHEMPEAADAPLHEPSAAPCDCGCDCEHPCAPAAAKLIQTRPPITQLHAGAAMAQARLSLQVADPSPQRLLRPPIGN